MSAKTEAALRNWRSDDAYPSDDAHAHFDSFGRWDWCEVAEEGRRIWQVMFREPLEEESPIASIISAVAAQASHGAYSAVAAALGVDADSLRIAAAKWSEEQDNPPCAVSTAEFMELVAHYAAKYPPKESES